MAILEHCFGRRDFLKSALLAGGGSVVCGGVAGTSVQKRPAPDFIWAVLVHLSRAMWGDLKKPKKLPFDDGLWTDILGRFAAAGGNMIVLDLGDGVVYPSHSELAVEGAWTPERLRREIVRCAAMGIELIPKVNFSSCHDAWLGPYEHMLSTPVYYEVCRDILKDVSAMFDRPRFIHLGFDEETAEFQTVERGYSMVVVRQGDLWWRDFKWFVSETEKLGSRAWAWCDLPRRMPRTEWEKGYPKGVMMSPWCHFGEIDHRKRKVIHVYLDVAEAGYDVVPCSSNCYDVSKNCRDRFLATVEWSASHMPRTRLKGFLHAPWCTTLPGSYYASAGLTADKQWAKTCDEVARAVAFWKKEGAPTP